MTNMMNQLTEDSAKLFKALAEDSCNWNGTPLWDGNPKDNGNLSDLKKKDLVITLDEEDCIWVMFTDLGREVALKELGIEIEIF